MLSLKNINKSYKTGNFTQKALDNVSLTFNKTEFVSILGPSGSGKTTLLNIIGGLDRYDSGDLIIKGKSTKKFKDKDWDSYRNNSVGFIFQNYNLIGHIDILSNVEMGMTLSGKSARYRKKKALEMLKKVGLEKHAHKKPNQLSGGQMQRVAIARALSNNPEIILADEPTGALDSKTSLQIMDLIKEISKDKLVIMVTHNDELAKNYSDRIISMKDGSIINDTNNEIINEEKEEYKLNKTKMSFLTALYLSLNNIKTKKGRTILTAFASSIGIIGISLILALSNGFSKQIDKFERSTSDAMPVIISTQKIDNETVQSELSSNMSNNKNEFSSSKSIEVKKDNNTNSYNNITEEYMNYIKNINKDYISSVNLTYNTNLNLIQKQGDKYFSLNSLSQDANSFIQSFTIGAFPYKNFDNDEISEIIKDYYDVLYGKLPNEKDEVVIEVDSNNSINKTMAKALGLEEDNISFEKVLNSTIKMVFNDEYYKNYGEYFIPKEINEELYNNQNNLTLKVVGIIRVKKEKSNIVTSSNSIYYTNSLINYVFERNNESEIVKKASESKYNVFTGEPFDENTESGKKNKELLLSSLGKITTPSMIYLYPKNFDTKDSITSYLDKYNEKKEEKDKVTYLDQAKLITNISGGIMTGITSVLVAFSSISLIVSSIMIGIITYISVLERVKEIGILRSLGARKKDIRRVFNAETFIIGLTSGLLGILISRLLLFPINIILKNLTDLDNVAIMNLKYSVILISISILLTLIGGSIPSRIASKKDPVESLRSE